MAEKQKPERKVLVYTAESESEALVVRGLLESSGMQLSGTDGPDPFPLVDSNMSRGTNRGVDVYVYEADANEARRIINAHLLRHANRKESDTT